MCAMVVLYNTYVVLLVSVRDFNLGPFSVNYFLENFYKMTLGYYLHGQWVIFEFVGKFKFKMYKANMQEYKFSESH